MHYKAVCFFRHVVTGAWPDRSTHSSGLFMAFTQAFNTGYSMGIKSTPWSDAHFPPTDTGEILSANTMFSVYPNPFIRSFKLNSTQQVEQLAVQLVDPSGRVFLKSNGSLEEINQALLRHSNELAPGHYFLHVSDDKRAPEVLKLSKIR